MKLSVIIPFLNAESYLNTVVASCVCAQRKGEYEIILVDDGSTDGSPALAEELASQHSGISVIHQENKGLGGARNAGIAAARGEYVWFVDADDWLEDGAVDYLCRSIGEHPTADYISICSTHSEGGGLRNLLPAWLSAKELFLSDKWLDMSTVYVLRTKFLQSNGLTFTEHLFFEDSELTPKIIFLADSCFISNMLLYNILDHEGTITRTHSVKKAYDRIRVAEELMLFRDSNVRDRASRQVFNRRICVMLNRALWEIGFSTRVERRKLNSFLRDKRKLMHVFAESTQPRYRLELMLFGLSGGNYSGTFRFVNLFKGI